MKTKQQLEGVSSNPIPVNINNSNNSSNISVNSRTYRKKGGLALLIFILIIILIGGGLFLFYKFYLTPIQIKEKISYLKEVFSDYTETVEKIIDYMNDDSASDISSESIKISYEKGKTLIKEYQEIDEKLKKKVEEVNFNETRFYINNIKDYLKKTDELYKLTKSSVEWGEAFYPLYKKYEESSVALGGVSNYLYYDPDKYISSLNEFLKKDEEVINGVKKIKVSFDLEEINKLMAEKLEIEFNLISELKEAVEKREISKIAEAQKKYSEEELGIAKKIGAEMEKIDDKIKDISRQIKSLNDKINDEYNQLRNKYRF
ncbi:MAG: hypothetical protein N2482_00550 [Patescibacteria group bacterium]|nr:hypothetical protein [Patescibacteria group bacterium]